LTAAPAIAAPLASLTVPSIVEVVVCAVALEDKRWNKNTVRKRIRSDEQCLLNAASPLSSFRL
jgi:hypothetical protein